MIPRTNSDQRSEKRPEESMRWLFKRAITKKYFHFRGRANRTEFWSVMLPYFGVFGTMSVLSIAYSPHRIVYATQFGVESNDVIFIAIFALLALIGMFLVIPMISVSSRRLHDSGLSAWWLLVFLILPFLFAATQILHWPFFSADIFKYGNYGLFFLIMSRKGTDGPNIYGDVPDEALSADIAEDGESVFQPNP